MTIYRLFEEPIFPHPEHADPDGLLAIGGDLSPQRLINAYSCGIFPWFNQGSPILWWSTDPRLVLFPEELHVPRSLRRVLNAGRFGITFDRDFRAVIEHCAAAERAGQDGTWLTREMIEAYAALHEMGLAHSVEAWSGGELVGGIYGIALGKAFFGESMFHAVPDASKVALVALVRTLGSHGFRFLDCQQTTDHMLRFGAREIGRGEFLARLNMALRDPHSSPDWSGWTVSD